MAALIWTHKAAEQLEQVRVFIAADSPTQARRVVRLIVQKTRELRAHPRIGRMIPEMRQDQYRELLVFSYRIFYRMVSADEVHVLAVVHGRRSFDPHWLQQ